MKNSLLGPGPFYRKIKPADYDTPIAKLCHMNLSADEEKAVELLSLVSAETFYGTLIRDAFIDYSVEKVRTTFKELWHQMDDNEDFMFQILGHDCYNALLKIKPANDD